MPKSTFAVVWRGRFCKRERKREIKKKEKKKEKLYGEDYVRGSVREKFAKVRESRVSERERHRVSERERNREARQSKESM